MIGQDCYSLCDAIDYASEDYMEYRCGIEATVHVAKSFQLEHRLVGNVDDGNGKDMVKPISLSNTISQDCYSLSDAIDFASEDSMEYLGGFDVNAVKLVQVGNHDSKNDGWWCQVATRANAKEDIPEYLVEPDDFFIKKDDKVVDIVMVYKDKNHLKALHHREAHRLEEKKKPVERIFKPPMSLQDAIDDEFLLGSAVDGLKSHTYLSVNVKEVDQTTNETLGIIHYPHQFIGMEIHNVKPEYKEFLTVPMTKGRKGRKRSVNTVDEIVAFNQAFVEVQRDDGQKIVLYYGSAGTLLCAAGTRSEFLTKYFDHTYDILCNPRAMVDFVCADNGHYVHYMLFARRVGETEYTMVNCKAPTLLNGLRFQATFYSEQICGILFIIVAINPAPDTLTDDPSHAPFCVPAHPQDQAGHIVMIDGHLQLAIFGNTHGWTISNNLIGTAGARVAFIADAERTLATADEVTAFIRRRRRRRRGA